MEVVFGQGSRNGREAREAEAIGAFGPRRTAVSIGSSLTRREDRTRHPAGADGVFRSAVSAPFPDGRGAVGGVSRRVRDFRRPVMPDPVRSRKPPRLRARRSALVTADDVLEFEREVAGASPEAVRAARAEPKEPKRPPTTAAVLREAQARRDLEGDCCFSVRGMTQGEARSQLERFLRERRAAGVPVVKVIHGKGKGSPGEPVLRRRVPEWLDSWKPELVAGYEMAQSERAGGSGALFVALAPTGGPPPPPARRASGRTEAG